MTIKHCKTLLGDGEEVDFIVVPGLVSVAYRQQVRDVHIALRSLIHVIDELGRFLHEILQGLGIFYGACLHFGLVLFQDFKHGRDHFLVMKAPDQDKFNSQCPDRVIDCVG